MQIKTTKKFHLTSVRMTFIKKRQKIRSVAKDGERKEHLCTISSNVF